MKLIIKSIKLKNLKSFKDEILIEFDNNLNILIGPNAGGKSNLLDIIKITLNKFFFKPYTINRNRSISQQVYFNNWPEKYLNDLSNSEIELEFVTQKIDIKNIEAILENKDFFEKTAQSIQNSSNYIKTFYRIFKTNTLFSENLVLKYSIVNEQISCENDYSQEFLHYSNYFRLFENIIRYSSSNIDLIQPFLFFSPYRSSVPTQLRVTLSQQNYDSLVPNYYKSTTRSVSNLIQLGTAYFAKKHRDYEATLLGDAEVWDKDNEVKNLRKFLSRLDYGWDLNLIDPQTNEYITKISKLGNDIDIEIASSGEREIINFVLGVFSFNVSGGLLLIDEPELHLHPRWQKMLISLFDQLSESNRIQFFLSTHSPSFITENNFSKAIRIYQENNISKVIAPDKNEENANKTKEILAIVRSENNEKMFFADKVVLVEGITDRLVFEKLIEVYSEYFSITDVLEVLEVRGKSSLEKYRNFLENFSVPNYIIADNDYLYDIGDQEIKAMFEIDNRKIDNDILKNKKSYDCDSLIERLENYVKDGNKDSVLKFIEYLKSRKRKLKNELSEVEKNKLNTFLKNKESERIFVLEMGEIEDYLPKNCKKLNNVIELVRDPRKFNEFFCKESKKREELDKIVFSIIDKDFTERQAALANIKENLVKEKK